MKTFFALAFLVILGQLASETSARQVTEHEGCICTYVWAPVCGFDNQTYGNSCAAYCAGVKVQYYGECQHGKQ